MRTQKAFRTVTALALVLSLLMSGCISAFAADITEPVEIINGQMLVEGVWVDVEIIDGSIIVTDTATWDPALEVIEKEDDDDDEEDEEDELEVEGDVINEQEDRDATFEDENGVSGYYYTNADGQINYGWKTVTIENEGKTNVSVGGNVDGGVYASTYVDQNDIGIEVGGKVDGHVKAETNSNDSTIN